MGKRLEFSVYVILFVLLISCKKDDHNPNGTAELNSNNDNKIASLEFIFTNSQGYSDTTYLFLDYYNNRIDRVIAKSKYNSDTTEYLYNDLNQLNYLVKSNYFGQDTMSSYEYDYLGRLVKETFFYYMSNETYHYKYNGSGISQINLSASYDSLITSIKVNTLLNNLTSVNFSSGDGIPPDTNNVSVFSFDDKINPLKNFFHPRSDLIRRSSANNLTKSSYYENGQLKEENHYQLSYNAKNQLTSYKDFGNGYSEIVNINYR